MKVLITGGAGFLGRRLVEALLRRGTLKDGSGQDRRIESILTLDLGPATATGDARVSHIVGDLADAALLDKAVDADTTSIFHLAAVVSGMAESDFDLGMRVNIDASRALLDVSRARKHKPTIVFASSVAVYGGSLPDTVLDTTSLAPQSSYGVQKAIVELLLHDYTRRSFVDGRVLRLPTISVRPGRPNAAASSFASGIVREPLNGETAICPVDPATRLWLLSPETAIDCFIAVHDARSADLGSNRNVNAPGLSVTVAEMIESVARLAGPDVAARIRVEPEPRIERIVASWPGAWDTTRARALGLPGDDSFDTIVRRYMSGQSIASR